MSLSARIQKRLPAVQVTPPFNLDVSLEVNPGITVLLGPSGSGKSLTLDCIAGLAQPDRGRVMLGDQILFDAEARVNIAAEQRRCGYVFQDGVLFPHMTVRQNLRFAAAVARGPIPRGLHMRRRIADLLDSFGLSELTDRKPGQLSGGQRQRAALARVLVGEPRVLLLDEPSQGLDSQLRRSFYEVLKAAQRRQSLPVVLVTHDIAECFALADEVYVMQAGRCLQHGAASEVLRRPVSLQVVRMLGLHAIWPAEIRALDPGRNTSRLLVGGAEIQGPYLPGHLIGDHGYLCVRSSELRVHRGAPQANDLVLSVRAVQTSPLGTELVFGDDVTATISASEYNELGRAETAVVHIPGDAISFLPGTTSAE